MSGPDLTRGAPAALRSPGVELVEQLAARLPGGVEVMAPELSLRRRR